MTVFIVVTGPLLTVRAHGVSVAGLAGWASMGHKEPVVPVS